MKQKFLCPYDRACYYPFIVTDRTGLEDKRTSMKIGQSCVSFSEVSDQWGPEPQAMSGSFIDDGREWLIIE